MKRSLVIFSFLLSFAGLTAAFAVGDAGEGYARPTFKEVVQTVVMLGGLDINKSNIADEYGRLVYCRLYRENYKNDFEWNKIRRQYVARVKEKKEPFRILYEVTGVFKLGRYDFERQSYPLSDETAMINVGSVALIDPTVSTSYCLKTEQTYKFPNDVSVAFKKPITVKDMKVPLGNLQKVNARMDEIKGYDGQVYGRIRMRVLDVLNMNEKTSRAELRGEVTAVDFFLDKDMTKMVGSAQLKK